MLISIDLGCSQPWSEKLLQWAAVSAETHNYSKCWEKVTVECSARKGTFISVPVPKGSRKIFGRKCEKNVRARGWGVILWNALIWIVRVRCTHELIAAVVTCTRLVQDRAHHRSGMDAGVSQEGLAPAEELLLVTACCGRRDYFIQWGSHWKVAHPTTENLMVIFMKAVLISSLHHKMKHKDTDA